MKNNITVYPELIRFHIATEDGWFPVYGHKVHVNGYDLFFHPKEIIPMFFTDLIVTEPKTGLKMTSFLIGPEEMDRSVTKEETLESWGGYAERVAEFIEFNGKEKIDKEIKRLGKEVIAKHGVMPMCEVVEE